VTSCVLRIRWTYLCSRRRLTSVSKINVHCISLPRERGRTPPECGELVSTSGMWRTDYRGRLLSTTMSWQVVHIGYVTVVCVMPRKCLFPPGRKLLSTFYIQYLPKVTHGPAHFLRARSAWHEWTTHAQQTRHGARAKCSYEARMSRRCVNVHANATRMLYRWGALHMREKASSIRVAYAM
jgi:hypothetical protein